MVPACYHALMHKFIVSGGCGTGYRWVLVAPNGETICRSDRFATEAMCLYSITYLREEIGNTVIVWASPRAG
jgi:uncharacterized protein YegP (UPF0339 family)